MDGVLRELRRRVEASPEDVELCAELGRALGRAGDPLAPAYEAGLLCAPSTLERLALEGWPALLVGGDAERRERVARTLHGAWQPPARRWISHLPGWASENAFENELFGYERVAGFIGGGLRIRPGALEQDPRSLLFLDDVEQLPRSIQRGLRGVVARRTLRRVGSEVEIPVDVRLVAGSTRDLASPLARQLFDPELGALLQACVLPLAPG